ncbi:DUF3822 family protein [Pseudofulvibacter geojedonensis]|uniref:DUF3822 family protein n=1 Tax=Pseudofulvibacter geojedonensis TaxID=1123758 RepID=A0ABW3HY30_9FLAO
MKLVPTVTGQENMTKKSSLNILSNLQLSVQASLDGLSFCILDTIEKNIVALEEFYFDKQLTPLELEQKLQELFISNEFLQQEFKQVSLIHKNNLATFVPKDLFKEENLIDYLKFNNKIFESDFIATDEIVPHSIISVFVPLVNINNFFFDRFGSLDYHHSSTLLVKKLLHQVNSFTTKLYCHVSKNSFELVYVKEGKLQFYNHFSFTTKEDFIYFLLFTIEQLEIDTETIDFIFLGNIGLDDEVYSLVYQYIRNVSFGSRETQFVYRDPEQKPKYGHDHFTLLNTF